MTTATPSLPERSYRIDAIDLLRGLVMIIMALDHTRENFHIHANTTNALDLQTTTPILFFTRWITHFCAPVFVALSGTSIYLQGLRKSKEELTGFLIKRGLWLVVVELVLVTFAITFDVRYGFIVFQVIWVIGISMFLLGLLIRLPYGVLLVLGLVIVFGHNALDFYERNNTALSPGYGVLHRPTFIPLGATHTLAFLYPFLPWTGVMLLGYCFGKIYRQPDEGERDKRMVAIGIGLILLFVLLRFINVYGDPFPWSKQRNGLYTFLSFINTQKYPPSLLYLCMTIGPALLFLGTVGRVKNRLTAAITVYGRVPFFYYVLHFYLLHLGTAVLFLARGHSFAEGVRGTPALPFRFIVAGEGVSLLMVYVVWLSLVVLLYPACRWFSRYKQTHRQWWLSYV